MKLIIIILLLVGCTKHEIKTSRTYWNCDVRYAYENPSAYMNETNLYCRLTTSKTLYIEGYQVGVADIEEIDSFHQSIDIDKIYDRLKFFRELYLDKTKEPK